MHVPRRLKELSVRLSRVLDDLTTELGRSPTVAELAKAVGGRRKRTSSTRSTRRTRTRRGRCRRRSRTAATTTSRTSSAPRTRDSAKSRTALSSQAGLAALDERERQIVELRFFEEMTQSQIAAEIGISQMHVSRLLATRARDHAWQDRGGVRRCLSPVVHLSLPGEARLPASRAARAVGARTGASGRRRAPRRSQARAHRGVRKRRPACLHGRRRRRSASSSPSTTAELAMTVEDRGDGIKAPDAPDAAPDDAAADRRRHGDVDHPRDRRRARRGARGRTAGEPSFAW